MNYVEIEIPCDEHLREILTAELWELGYEGFMDTEGGLKAYQSAPDYNQRNLQRMLAHYPQAGNFQAQEIAQQNWNETWESNFNPITVGQDCRVRASFHAPSSAYKYEVVINPKMSFGTGHHETTSQMMQQQLALNHQEKSVLDVGCGTGILSILAEKLGASTVLGVDLDTWSVENAQENVQINECQNIEVVQGTVSSLNLSSGFDVILANINRNVLLEEIPVYKTLMKQPGHLIISGFYTEDLPQIVNISEANGLLISGQTITNNWACLIFELN